MCVLLIFATLSLLTTSPKLPKNSKTGDVVSRGNLDNTSFKLNFRLLRIFTTPPLLTTSRQEISSVPYQQYLPSNSALSLGPTDTTDKSSRSVAYFKSEIQPRSQFTRPLLIIYFHLGTGVNSTVFKHLEIRKHFNWLLWDPADRWVWYVS